MSPKRGERGSARQRWKDLSPGRRRLIIAVAAVESGLKAAMLIDLRRRPSSGVRGSKRLWAASALINSAGLIPLTYFVLGRRRGGTEAARASIPQAGDDATVLG